MKKRSLLRGLAALAVNVVFAPAVSAAPIAPAQHTNPQPLITSEFEALDNFANGGKFIIFGDSHIDSDGHRALADLMPTLKRSKVTVLGIEFPPSMNPTFAHMQHELRNGASIKSIAQEFVKELSAKTGADLRGGEQFSMDLAEIMSAATQQGIRVVGIDPRGEDRDFMRASVMLTERGGSTAEWYDLGISRDTITAKIAAQEIASDPPESRMAIMFGAGHSCHDRGDLVLAGALERYGSVTQATLFTSDTAYAGFVRQLCNKPAIGPQIDPDSLHRSLHEPSRGISVPNRGRQKLEL